MFSKCNYDFLFKQLEIWRSKENEKKNLQLTDMVADHVVATFLRKEADYSWHTLHTKYKTDLPSCEELSDGKTSRLSM